MTAYEPLILTGVSSAVALNSTAAPDNINSLRCPTRSAVLVDAVGFEISAANLGLWARCKLDLGRTPLTRQFVSVACLSRLWDERRESPTTLSGLSLNGQVIGAPTLSRYMWQFARPLYMNPGELLVPTWYYSSDGALTAPATVNCRVTYYCRMLPRSAPPPRKRDVPWAAEWVSASYTPPGGSPVGATLSSTEADLYNPFDSPFVVRELCGRISKVTAGAAGEGSNDAYELSMIRMHRHDGQIIVRDPTPFGTVFSRIDKSWRCEAVLEPGGFVAVDFDPGGEASAMQAHVSLLGYREVEL